MSLINQMLQDLDERRAAHGVGANLPNDVRPLPRARQSNIPLGLAVAGAGLVIVLGIVGVFFRDEVAQRLFGVVATVTESRAPAAPAASAVVPTVVAPSERAPVSVVAEPPPEPAVEVDVSLRMADFIDPPDEAARVEQEATVSPPREQASATEPGEMKSKPTQPSKPPTAAVTAARPIAEKAVAKPGEKNAELPAKQIDAQINGRSEAAPAIERTPANGSPHERAENDYRKAITAVNQGRVSEAIDNLRNALRQDSLHVASRQLLVKLLLEARNQDEAIQVLQDGIAGQPAQLGWAMSLARLQVDGGELDGAWKTLEHSLPAARNSPDYLGFAANVLQRLGRTDEAAEQYRKATRIAPSDGRWWLGLGWCLDAQGQTAEAREAFLRARQSGNLSPELLTLIDQKLR